MKKYLCKHAFYVEKNDCWYCDTSMFPVDEDCKMACFTPLYSKTDNAWDLRNILENIILKEKDD